MLSIYIYIYIYAAVIIISFVINVAFFFIIYANTESYIMMKLIDSVSERVDPQTSVTRSTDDKVGVRGSGGGALTRRILAAKKMRKKAPSKNRSVLIRQIGAWDGTYFSSRRKLCAS